MTAHDGARIAVAEVGDGPVTLLKAGTWLSHIAQDADNPIWRHWLNDLARDYRYVRYDLRGCGLSDRDVSNISFETWLSDLEQVAESIDGPVTLLGLSQGCALSIAFALKHPAKVERLILSGSYAQGMLARGGGDRACLEAETLANLVQLGWGNDVPAFNQVFTNLFVPDGTPKQHDCWRRLERDSASPEVALKILEVLHRIDVSAEATKLDVPTLVFHSKNDARVPFEEGRKLAGLIPGAQFVALESANHILLSHEPAWDAFLSAIRSFLHGNDAIDLGKSAFGFTPAEAEVVALVAEGLANSEVAKALGKSEKTVRNQISVAFEKADVSSRSELIVKILSRR